MTDPLGRPDPFRLGGTVLDGRFHVAREVAEGGFGVVYYAIQIALDRPVALKVLKTPAEMDQAARSHFHDKFAAEARTIARIRHPNIVDVYDFGISKMPSGELAPWMALEWIDGKTLDDYLTARRGQGGQSPSDVLALLRPVLRALAYTHRDGIAHRDIKPSNIMVVSGGAGGTTTETGPLLRILDFGIAKVMTDDEKPGSGHTRTAGMPAFSPQYASPEQVAFGRTGPWTDVHALGLILTEMLVDEIPYQATDIQLFEEVMATKRPTPGTRGRNVGPWEGVLGKALALSPNERWKSAADLLAALEATVAAATSAASEPSRAPARATPAATLLRSAGTPLSLGRIATDMQLPSRRGAAAPVAETKPAASSRPDAPTDDASASPAQSDVSRRWRRSVVGGAAAVLVVAALVVAGIALGRRGSEPSPRPAIPANLVEQRSEPSPSGSNVTKEAPLKPGESPSASPPIAPRPAAVAPPKQPPRPAGIARATGNPRNSTPRKPPGPVTSNPPTTPQKPTEPAAKATERLPIE